jgi:glycogen synthase
MFALLNSMSDELLKSINEGVRIYQKERDQYFKMLTHGITYIQQNFSWERAASDYLSIFFSWERAASEIKHDKP